MPGPNLGANRTFGIIDCIRYISYSNTWLQEALWRLCEIGSCIYGLWNICKTVTSGTATYQDRESSNLNTVSLFLQGPDFKESFLSSERNLENHPGNLVLSMIKFSFGVKIFLKRTPIKVEEIFTYNVTL